MESSERPRWKGLAYFTLAITLAIGEATGALDSVFETILGTLGESGTLAVLGITSLAIGIESLPLGAAPPTDEPEDFSQLVDLLSWQSSKLLIWVGAIVLVGAVLKLLFGGLTNVSS